MVSRRGSNGPRTCPGVGLMDPEAGKAWGSTHPPHSLRDERTRWYSRGGRSAQARGHRAHGAGAREQQPRGQQQLLRARTCVAAAVDQRKHAAIGHEVHARQEVAAADPVAAARAHPHHVRARLLN
eukprot:scaffold12010_cov45-Phaeocystis_antarctica.AAC.2